MELRDKIFIQLLNKFTKGKIDILKASGYPWAPFIPYGFNEYFSQDPKIFYVGIDTYYWSTTISQLIESYNSQNYNLLFKTNDETVTANRLLGEWAYGKGPFWEFVCKMQIYLRTTVLKTTEDLRYLTDEEQKYLHQIGYGNCNMIEKPKALNEEGYWDEINKELYWQIASYAREIFSPIKNILDSYTPDIVFILGADEDDNYIFKDLNYKNLEQYNEKKWRKLYTVDGYKTKIIKTYHPRSFCRQGSNNNEMVEYLYESLKLF